MIMAAASSSSATPLLKYDVFLSFRGEDTRNNFTSHLHAALCRKKIETFIDNQLVRGEEISSSLLNTIKASKVSVIVFSENYAASTWCLQELEHILECKRMDGQIVIPVFYRVDPSHVRNQTEAFGDAFAKLCERFAQRLDLLQRWKAALEEAANLSGWTSNDETPESAVIDAAVGDILKGLNKLSPSDNRDLIGVELKIQKVESLISNELNGIGIVGIWGIGGIGKTTLARAVFNKILNEFEGSYFVENVREESHKNSELTSIRQKFLSMILEDAHSNIGHTFTIERLHRKKVLIVFDDVTSFEQIERLIGDLYCLGLGSRIIITTRNKQVLKCRQLDNATIYELSGLCDHDARQLFRKYAFRQNHPFEDYMELSNKIVRYTKGVPLALKILGSCPYGKEKQDWESEIERLDKCPHQDIQNVLKVSYDGLDNEERNIFLDIVFFFKGWKSCHIKDILDASGFSTWIGLTNLIDKSLITISYDIIDMHDLLQEMAKEIVKQECVYNPRKRSRLYHHEDICSLLSKNKGSKTIQGIYLEMSKMRDITLDPFIFAKMPNLRVFEVYNSNYGESKLHGFEALESFSTKLTCFGWNGYPMKSLPLCFCAENLVRLEMPDSKVKRLWNGVQNLVKLKHINLSHSKCLKKIPNLSKAINIQELILEGCTRLFKITPSVQNLQKLVKLNVEDCQRLRRLPTVFHSKSLTDVILSGCSNLKKAPKIPRNVESLYLDGTAIKKLPLIEYPSRLVTLDLGRCKRLESLPDSFCQLKFLQYLYLDECSKLERLPDNLGSLEALVKLAANQTAIREVPSSIVHLNKLFELHLGRCNGRESMGLVLPPLSGLSFLVDLDLDDCEITKLPESLGRLSSLKCLGLSRNKFESIPASIKDLYNLLVLHLNYCKNLQSLPELAWGVNIKAHGCSSLKSISNLPFPLSSMTGIRTVNLTECHQLDQNELWNRVKESLLRLRHKKLYQQTSVSICFPGYDIPEWFSFLGTGSKFPAELQPCWFNNSFLGFVMCVVIECQGYHFYQESFWIRCICIIKSEGGEKIKRVGRLYSEKGVRNQVLRSDHVFLGYDFQMQDPLNVWDPLDYHYVDLNFNNKASFEFFVEDDGGQKIDSCKVKKCGVHFLSAHDCVEAMEGTSRIVNSIKVVEVADEEEEPADCGDPMEGTSRDFDSVEVVEVESAEDEEEPHFREPMMLEGTSTSFNPVVDVVDVEDDDEEPSPKRLKYIEFF